jgi:hypothetical protein
MFVSCVAEREPAGTGKGHLPPKPAEPFGLAAFGLAAIWRAYRACRQGKRHTRETQRYEARLLDRLVSTRDALASFGWRPSRTLAFVVHRPKRREIHAATFSDRVVHHLLVDRLNRIYEPIFIHDSYANRLGKGTHAAVDRLQAFMRQSVGAAKATSRHKSTRMAKPCRSGFNPTSAHQPPRRVETRPTKSDDGTIAAPTRTGPSGPFALQLDIANCFNSIHRPTLFRLLQQRLLRAVRRQGLDKDEARALQSHCRALLAADPTAHVRRQGSPAGFAQIPPHKRLGALGPAYGLPVGNLTSQFFANVYLNELDQFVKHTLKARYYVRYVDDFVLLHADPAVLLDWRQRIVEFLAERLRLKLKELPEPQAIADGVDFLGYVIRPSHCVLRRRVITHFHQRLAAFQHAHVRTNALRLPPVARDRLRAQIASFLGHCRHASAERVWQKTLTRFPWLHTVFEAPENALRDRRLRPAWTAVAVSGLAGQYRTLRRRHPDALWLLQVGNRWRLPVSQPRRSGLGRDGASGPHPPIAAKAAPTKSTAGLGPCLEFRASDLAGVRRRLKRAGQAHALAAQTGHFKTGFKRRELVLIWRPPGAPSFLSAARTVI